MLSDEEINKRKKAVLLSLLALLFIAALGAVPMMINQTQPSDIAGVGTTILSAPATPLTTPPPSSTPQPTAAAPTETQPGQTALPATETGPDEFAVSTSDLSTAAPGSSPTQTTPESTSEPGSDETPTTDLVTAVSGSDGGEATARPTPTQPAAGPGETAAEPSATSATTITPPPPPTGSTPAAAPTGGGAPTQTPATSAAAADATAAQVTPPAGSDAAKTTPTREPAPGDQAQTSPTNTPTRSEVEPAASPGQPPAQQGELPEPTTETGPGAVTATPSPASDIAEHMRGEATAALATGSDTTSPEQTAAASDQPAAEGQPTPDAVSTAPETAPPANLPVTGVEKAYTHWILLGLAFSLFALLLLYGAIAVDQVDP